MSEKGSRGINQPLNEGLASELTLARELKALTMLHKLAISSSPKPGWSRSWARLSTSPLPVPKLVGAESSDLKIRAHRGFPQWWLDFWDRTHSGQGACGTALGCGERVIVEHVEQRPIFRGTPAIEMPRRAGIRAV